MSFVELKDDLLYEIGYLIPPTEPTHLVKAALTCKRWGAILTSIAFRRNYFRRHGSPPFLGYFHNSVDELPRFVSTTSPLIPASALMPDVDTDAWYVLDARHGRLLLHQSIPSDDIPWTFIVWNPITGDHHYLPPAPRSYQYFAGAVLCADPECQHVTDRSYGSHCPHGPFFRVVFIGSDEPDSDDSDTLTFKNINWACIYSSETDEWSSCSEMDDSQWGYQSHPLVEQTPPILFAGSLYFRFEEEMASLKFDVDNQLLSMLYFPEEADENADAILITTEERMELVGYADVGGEGEEDGEVESHIHIWTWRDNSEWTVRKVIRLEDIFHETVPLVGASLLGSIEGTDTVFMGFGASIFSVDLSSLKTTKMGPRIQSREVLPFSQFFTPRGKITGILPTTVSVLSIAFDGIVSHETVNDQQNADEDVADALVIEIGNQAEVIGEKRGIESGSPLHKKAKIEDSGHQTDAAKQAREKMPADKPPTQNPAAASAAAGAENMTYACGIHDPPQ